MNQELVSVVNHRLPLVMYRDQPVVTFAMVDQVHQRAEGTARRIFQQNKDRFLDGKHYYCLQGEALSEFRSLSPGVVGCNIPKLILLTERGYYLAVKSLTDDLSWNVQERMSDAYFCAKSVLINDVILSSILRDVEQIKSLLLPRIRGPYKPRIAKEEPKSSKDYGEIIKTYMRDKDLVLARDLRKDCAPELSAAAVGRLASYTGYRAFDKRVGEQVLRAYRGDAHDFVLPSL